MTAGLRSDSLPSEHIEPSPALHVSTTTHERAHQLELVLVRFSLLVVWAIAAVVFIVLEPGHFLTISTLQAIFGTQEPLVFVVVGMVLTFGVGEFDLSAPFVMGLAATMTPELAVVDHLGLVVAIVVAIAACLCAGILNAVIVVLLGVDPVATTLGTGTFLLGLALAISHVTSVSGLSASFANTVNGLFLELPSSFYYGLGLVLVVAYVMSFTALGRHMLFVGSNREVARLAGIKVGRIRFGAFVFSAGICGIGGVLLAGSIGGYNPSSSTDYLLPVFSALALGTTAIYPGRFNPIGSFLAVYFLETGIIGLELLGYGSWVSDVFYGAALVIAVILATRVLPKVIGMGLLRRTKPM